MKFYPLKEINRSHRLNMALLLVELQHDENSGTIWVKDDWSNHTAPNDDVPLVVRIREIDI